jgi:hypothetical protein
MNYFGNRIKKRYNSGESEEVDNYTIWTYKKTYIELNKWWDYLLKNNKINL